MYHVKIVRPDIHGEDPANTRTDMPEPTPMCAVRGCWPITNTYDAGTLEIAQEIVRSTILEHEPRRTSIPPLNRLVPAAGATIPLEDGTIITVTPKYPTFAEMAEDKRRADERRAARNA